VSKNDGFYWREVAGTYMIYYADDVTKPYQTLVGYYFRDGRFSFAPDFRRFDELQDRLFLWLEERKPFPQADLCKLEILRVL